MPSYSFCQTAVAAGRWHIRELTAKGRCCNGGADTKTLCGLEAAWDINVPLGPSTLNRDGCVICVKAYVDLVGSKRWQDESV
jgi:hypothetical protein